MDYTVCASRCRSKRGCDDSAAVVQWLTGGAEIAIVFRFIAITLGTKERTVLAMDAVTGPHVRSDAAIRQPLQELTIAVGRVGRHRFWGSSLLLGETGKHLLCGHRLLTHARRCGLHSDNTQLSLSTR